ncbi:hypothetical protein BAY13_06330 [Elizabethkingia bruuniana]|uniref:hypothetical protein n=1 Tax=Elizabethkingia bruuniana TaxID=1756149 RepID=UPI00099A3A8C|nr:hypothetical protein [Elizabethkingia bruuniana]OPC62434.1 hypothetical protein BAY13_06330 [Elizabethkingia bruuniana]
MSDMDTMNEWKNNLPIEIESNLNIIKDICNKINSFDLISYISFYNHLYNPEEYTDYRGDKQFFVSETIACQCLKSNFVENNSINSEEILKEFLKIQDATLKYCAMTDVNQMSEEYDRGDVFGEIMSKIKNESKHVRNPGHPKHHLAFSKKLFEPFESQIVSIFGFTLDDSIIIRDKISFFLNFKYNESLNKAVEKAKYHSKETISLKNKKKCIDELTIKVEDIEEIVKLSDLEIRTIYKNHFFNELMVNYSEVGAFTANELAIFLEIDENNVEKFLDRFSCSFGSIKDSEDIYQSNSILKQKPLIKYSNRYVIPSIPLLVWVVEETFENEFKKNSKLYGKFISHKHDFLINEAESYFKNILPKSQFYANMFYGNSGREFETDGLLIFNDYLFIIEAKANRLSNKAKSGHRLKTDDQLNDIIKNSYDQSLRVLSYLKEHDNVIFQDKKRQKINLQLNNFKDVILVSLTLEQLGNIVPILKTTNKLNYFDDNHFPWIISIYDLVVISDFFETPSLLLSYLEIRNKFLSYENTYIYEELDLIGYFLKQKGNILNYTIERNKNEGLDYFYFEPETDFINNYYMYKFNFPNKYIKKPTYFDNLDFRELIYKIDQSNLSGSIDTSVRLMKYNKNSISDFSKRYKKVVKQFYKDKQLHDCSIFTKEQGGFGFTYMVGKEDAVVKESLGNYIEYKKSQLLAGMWIGIGEVNGVVKYLYSI